MSLTRNFTKIKRNFYKIINFANTQIGCINKIQTVQLISGHKKFLFLSLNFRFLTEVLLPIVKTEFQLLYVYHLVGPFLQRFQQERTRCMIEVKYNLGFL